MKSLLAHLQPLNLVLQRHELQMIAEQSERTMQDTYKKVSLFYDRKQNLKCLGLMRHHRTIQFVC